MESDFYGVLTRETCGNSFGTAANASIGVLVRLGTHLRVGVDAKIEALMRLDVQNGYDSTFELMWIPASLTLGITS